MGDYKYSYFCSDIQSETKIVIFVNFVYIQQRGHIKIKEQNINMKAFCSIKYISRSFFNFFSKTKYMIGVCLKETGSHTATKITPKLPAPGANIKYSGFLLTHQLVSVDNSRVHSTRHMSSWLFHLQSTYTCIGSILVHSCSTLKLDMRMLYQ